MDVQKKRLAGLLAAAILMLTILSACANNPEEPPPVSLPEPVVEQANEAPSAAEEANTPDEETPAVLNPLTGLAVQDPQILDRRPVMVKVSNFPRNGRPHAGLSFADIVFDYYIGFGTNRFLALYYGQDTPEIWPLRSGRRVDAQLSTMYSGVLGYGSADADTDAVLAGALGNYAISYLEAECPVFCGEETHDAIGVYANSAEITRFVDAQGWENGKPDLHGMEFSEAPQDGTQKADQVTILFNAYNRAEWRFDNASGKYLRWIEHVPDEYAEPLEWEMVPLVDKVTGDQLAFSNVVVIFAPYTELAPSAHEIAIWGNKNGLPAYLFRDGGMTAGEWVTANDSDPMQFINPNGTPMAFKPGNTWIAIMGLSSSFRETQPGNWETFFFLP